MFSIVYEPEAASVYARLLPVDRFVGENKTTILKTFDPGKKFIVVDAGGKIIKNFKIMIFQRVLSKTIT